MYHNSALQGSSGCRKKALAKLTITWCRPLVKACKKCIRVAKKFVWDNLEMRILDLKGLVFFFY